MTDIAQALTSLGINEWTMRGNPESKEDFEKMFVKITGADENGNAIESSDPKDFGVTWDEVKAEQEKLIAAEPMKLLRAERNMKLVETDWWASSDLTMTDAQKKYRQDLRDITKTYDSLEKVKWPTKP